MWSCPNRCMLVAVAALSLMTGTTGEAATSIPASAEILSGISKVSGLRVPIDSWHEEVQFLTPEGGVWRIRGNAGETPRVLPFGTAPHPAF